VAGRRRKRPGPPPPVESRRESGRIPAPKAISRGFRGKCGLIDPMREVLKSQLSLGQVAIEDIDLNPNSRDDIPAILRGIQDIYCNETLRNEILEVMRSHMFLRDAAPNSGDSTAEGGVPDRLINPNVGRPGMDLWTIFALAVLKQGLNCDYDRLHELALHHNNVRAMLGLDGIGGPDAFSHRTVVRNVSLLTDKLLDKINVLVVRAGYEALGKGAQEPIAARADSFVVETHVEYPTDKRLLWNAVKALIVLMAVVCGERGVAGWRKAQCLVRKVYRLFQLVRTERKSKKHPKRVRKLLKFALEMADRAAASREELARKGAKEDEIRDMEVLEGLVRRLADMVERRILKGEKIPHEEKVFSIYKPFTRWCKKGKAGVVVELGVPVTVVESHERFILNHRVMWEEEDVEVAVEVIRETQEKYPNLESCSFDRGYYSPEGREELDKVLKVNAMPKKGYLNEKDRKRQGKPEFVEARRMHAGVESAINGLEQRGLDRVREYGRKGFARMVALSVVAANVHRLGRIQQAKDRVLQLPKAA